MKRIYPVLLLLIISVIAFKCQKEYSSTAFQSQANNLPSPVTATLQGNILDENDQPVEGVMVSVGVKTATTNSHGYFRIVNAPLDKNASLITAEEPGYFKAYRTFRGTSGVNQVVIKLIKKTLIGTIDATTGGNAILTNGAAVLLPANGVVNANGDAYTGSINVYAAYINPAANDIGKKVPGSFMADDKNNKRVVLSSFGMLAVNLESSTGEKLQIAANNTATLTIPISSSMLSSAPANISLWYVDEQTGIWKEQGTAQKNGNNYLGAVKHFSYWNCDSPSPGISFSATFTTSDNAPLTNTYIVVRPATSDSVSGYAHGYTDSLGQVSGLIPANANLVLEVYGGCNGVAYSKNIGPFTNNVSLGTIVVPNSIPSLITLTGKLTDCNNAPVSNGYATIYYDNIVYNLRVTAGGEFSTNFMTCSTLPQTVDVLGVDETAQQQGTPLTIPITGQVIDAGYVVACGTSSVQFLNYKLDGTDYTLSTSDSLVAYSSQGSGLSFITYVTDGNPTNPLSFNFSGIAAPGIYPINSLSVANYNNTTLTQPFKVTITAYPQNRGEFYDGSFSGSFTDSSDPAISHTISCSFHIKKY